MTQGQEYVSDSKRIITTIVPAKRCNMRCAYCFIDMMKQGGNIRLSHDDYVFFTERLFDKGGADELQLVGHEVLLPEAWETTRALLAAAYVRGKSRFMITNGTYLAEHAAELGAMEVGIGVSLDAAQSEVHDRLRVLPGAFEAALQGIDEYQKYFPNILVMTVAFLKHHERLVGFPELLARHNVRHWYIGSLINKAGDKTVTGIRFVEMLAPLAKRAEELGVELIIDDADQTLKDINLGGIRVARRSPHLEWILRLTPSGKCQFGNEVDKPMRSTTPVWHRGIDPVEFVRAHAHSES